MHTVTFADKFSRFKSKFLLIFWSILILFGLKLSYSFFSTFYSITKMKDSYFSIEVKGDQVSYNRVDKTPPNWVPLSKISKRIQQAIISSEDGTFYSHPGYDLDQLRDAVNDSFVRKKKMRGASTITQQLAKNLYLTKNKSFGRKIRELVMAVAIEKYVSKEKILETYLNIIEYGKGLYGIEKASHYYFNKDPSKLTAREGAFIAMLLPSPIRYAKSFKNKSLTPFAKRMIDSILLKMRQAGYISEEEYMNQMNSTFSWEKVIAPDGVIDPEDRSDEETADESGEGE